MTEDDDLDGCELPFDDPEVNTGDDQVDVLVMFADVWDDPEAVEERRSDLVELEAFGDAS